MGQFKCEQAGDSNRSKQIKQARTMQALKQKIIPVRTVGMANPLLEPMAPNFKFPLPFMLLQSYLRSRNATRLIRAEREMERSVGFGALNPT